MKLINNIKAAALTLLAVSAVLASCKKNEITEARAVAAEVELMTFEGKNAAEQILPVFADGDWYAEVADAWITVAPMSGRGNTDVVITVADNVVGGVMDTPRKARIYFKGGSAERYATVTISQKGDKYKGLEPVTVAEAAKLAPEAVAKFTEVQVKAVSMAGMVVGDNTGVIYVEGVIDGVKGGDKVSLTGDIKADTTPNVVVLDPESADIISAGTASYGDAKNITSSIDSYEGSYLELVSVKGSIIGLANGDILAGAAIRVPGATKRMMVVEADAQMQMSNVNYHFVTVAGYFFGNMGANPSFIPAAVLEDGGIDESIVPVPLDPNTVLFSDDFEWMDPFVQEAIGAGTAIGDSVGENNASAAAPNLYTTATLANLGAEMTRRGYVDINAGITSIYPQANYWKFGKTSAHTGLQLPAIDYYGDLDLSFDWSPQMTTSGNIDKIFLIVMVTTGNSVVTAAQYTYEDWEKGHIAWHRAKAKIQITPESLIHIRPISLEDYASITQQRFYLDNIVVKVPGPDVDPVYADIKVSDDVVTFEGEGGEFTLKVTSDHDFTVATSDKWLTIENGEGVSGEETPVKIIAQASELSKLREGLLKITSADSERSIRVVQSAAGQDLDPFVALGSNKLDINYKGQVAKIKVQSTCDYTVASDVEWIALTPETKTMVNKEEVALYIAENASTTETRTGHVIFANEELGLESVLTVTQDVHPKAQALFEDDFSWLKPFIAMYNDANPTNPIGDTVGSQGKSANAPNAYTTAPFNTPEFAAAFAAQGYTDLNPGEKLIYPQDEYLKFSRTGGHNTAIALSLEKVLSGATALNVEFDFAMMAQGDGTIDLGPVTIQIVGDGQFDNGTKVHDGFNSTQEKGKYNWNHATMAITGATANTKLVFINKRVLNEDGTYNWAVSGAGRFFLDNIVITKGQGGPEPETIEWGFNAEEMKKYADHFGGAAGVFSKEAGNGGMYLESTVSGNGKIEYYQIDKTEIDTANKASRITGATGQPYVTGTWPGDYWLTSADLEATHPAGTKVSFHALSRCSGTGMRYWLIEYKDGDEWKPLLETVTEAIETGETVTYNVKHENTAEFPIDVTVTLTKATKRVEFRQTCVANAQASGKGALTAPNGGTHRYQGALAADGSTNTSTKIVVGAE